jgi:capsular exopolysaccharide synthesis family protein
MSRIQQILSKAEREGAVRHTHVPMPEPGAPVDTPPASTPFARPAAPPVAPAAARSESSPGPARPRLIEAGLLSPLLVAAAAPHGAIAEQFRAIRTRLAVSENGHSRRVLLVTSPAKGDGKSVTAGNLALTMAQEFSRRVVIVDADLRRPSLHTLFGLPQGPGLSDVLLGRAALEEVLVTLPDYRLTVLPAGPVPDAPAELLGSAGMRRVIDALRTRFDRVVVDSPPALPLADVGVLAPMTDGMLLVVRAGSTPKPLIDRALSVCDESQVVGLVLNDSGDSQTAYPEYGARTS